MECTLSKPSASPAFLCTSPFEDGKAITACAELHPKPNKQLYCEIWGEVPANPSLNIPLRTKFGSGYLTYPDGSHPNFNAFMDAMLKSVMQTKFYQESITDLLAMHLQAALETKNTTERE